MVDTKSTSPDTIIRAADLPAVCGLRRSQIATLIAEGELPKPIRLGARSRGWLAGEIRAWQKQRVAERDGTARKRLTEGA